MPNDAFLHKQLERACKEERREVYRIGHLGSRRQIRFRRSGQLVWPQRPRCRDILLIVPECQ